MRYPLTLLAFASFSILDLGNSAGLDEQFAVADDTAITSAAFSEDVEATSVEFSTPITKSIEAIRDGDAAEAFDNVGLAFCDARSDDEEELLGEFTGSFKALRVGQRVERGPDWVWYNQDGKLPGTVVEIVNWNDETDRAARVLWDTGDWNVYRWGAEMGRYDLKPIKHAPLVPLEKTGWVPLPTPSSGKIVEKEMLALKEFFCHLDGSNWRHKAGWEMLVSHCFDEFDGKGGEADTNVKVSPAADKQPNVNTDSALGMIDNLGKTQSRIVRAAWGGHDRPQPSDSEDPCLLPWDGIVCEEGHIISIRLDRNGLQGSLDDLSRLRSLSELRALDLSMNKLQGGIGSISTLSKLRWLNLANNQLQGPIPPSLGNLKDLEWMSLANNRLTGTIPEELGGLHNLSFAFLTQNLLQVRKGQIPQAFKALPKLAPKHPRVEGNL